MFIITAILIGIFIGMFRKGKISNLFKNLPSLWFFGLAGLLMQLGLHLVFYTGMDISWLRIINFISYLLIIAALVALTISSEGMWSKGWSIALTAGFLTNFIGIIGNGFVMPVSQEVLNGTLPTLAESISGGHNPVYFLMDSEATPLWFLGNQLCIPKVGAITGIYGAVPSLSIGTLAILLGLVGYISVKMRQQVPLEREDLFREEFLCGRADFDAVSNSMFLNEEEADVYDYSFFHTGRLNPEDQSSMDRDADLPADEGIYADEDVYTAITANIPKLTPEVFREIRRNSQDEAGDLTSAGNPATETQVFTSLSRLDEGEVEDMTNQEQMDFSGLTLFDIEPSDETVEEEQETVSESNDSAYVPQWEWKKPKKGNDALNQGLGTAVSAAAVGVGAAAVTAGGGAAALATGQALKSGRKQTEWNPRKVMRDTYTESREVLKNQRTNPYSTLFNSDEKKASPNRSLEEMRNIWHQNNENDKRRRKGFENRIAAESAEQPVDSPVSKVDVQPEDDHLQHLTNDEPGAAHTAYEQALEKVSEKWDEKKPSLSLKNLISRRSTERVDSKEILRKTLAQRSEKKVADAIIRKEREGAGYQKVELPVGGQIISFWRKKK